MHIKKLLPHQGLFLQSPFLYPKARYHFLVCGYGAGKTSSLATICLFLIKLLQGKKDRENHNARLNLGGINLGHLEKTTLAYIKEDLDMSHTKYTHDKKKNVFIVGTVSVYLVSLSDPQKITGFDVWASLADEVDDLGNLSQSDDLTFEAIKALNERTRQKIVGMRKPFLMFASTSQGQKGLYRVYTQFVKSRASFNLIRGRTIDNPHLDEDYVAALFKVYSPREREVYLEGKFLALSVGRVIGDFDIGKHYMPDSDIDMEIGREETVYWAQDFNTGYFRGCAMVLREGVIHIIKGYDFPEFRPAASVVRADFPNNRIVFIPDASATEQITHIRKELKQNSIYWVTRKKNPSVEDSAFLVNKLFYTNRMFVGKMAEDVAEALNLAQRDKNGKIPKGIGPNSPIHYCDSVRMGAYYLAANKPSLRDIRRVTIARRLLQEEKEEPVVQELDGYEVISPSA